MEEMQMLELRNINKIYQTGTEETPVLNAINLTLGDNEFVSILGASGSGKTTLLNVIGGLDQYTEGDLLVDGTSTKAFTDKEWDSYRNGTIGFVFQSYNLISHLTILDNVQMALSLSGISTKNGEERAKQALVEVGLGDHIRKKPNQLSGGQMQRVAIARALVNNPKILLADEPTGALDTKTSVQIMELIKKISKERLVVMVTHNPELAEQYSDRIIQVKDGKIVKDTRPYEGNREQSGYKIAKTAMSFWEAIKSSFNNLLTKKTRTAMVTFAGSIGIISIALVLALSSGMKAYIDNMQEDTLAGLPITISANHVSNSAMDMRNDAVKKKKESESTTVKKEQKAGAHENIFAEDVLGKGYTFTEYFIKHTADYDININLQNAYQLKALTYDEAGNVQEVKTNSPNSAVIMPPLLQSQNAALFSELPSDEKQVLSQYEVLATKGTKFVYPKQVNELILVVGVDNTLSAETLEAFGYDADREVAFEELLGKKFKIITNDNYYQANADSTYFNIKEIGAEMYEVGTEAEIVAIMRPKEVTNSLISSSIGYSKALADELLRKENESQIVIAQKENSEINILSPSNEKIKDNIYSTNMQKLGGDQTPTEMSVYFSTFDDRNEIVNVIQDYNKLVETKFGVDSENYAKYMIKYEDNAKSITEMMEKMIDTITIVLSAFSAISLVVSSVMIGILTYVSVVERTKEIGIMRALGARKKDITRVFNAEAGIIGFASGIVGVGIAYLCTFPINSIVENMFDIPGFTANLEPHYMIMLLVLSVSLTFIAGFIPSKFAAKKNPVEALRTE